MNTAFDITIGGLIYKEIKDIVVVPIGENEYCLLTDKESQTLEAFADVILKINSIDALPLEVYLLNGEPERLLIAPRKGGNIDLGGANKIKLYHKNCKNELVILSTNPYENR